MSEASIKCPTCGRDDFSSIQTMKLHHMQTHGESIAGELVTCEYCRKQVRKPPGEIAQSTHHFCSPGCHGAWRTIVSFNHESESEES